MAPYKITKVIIPWMTNVDGQYTSLGIAMVIQDSIVSLP